MMMQIPVFIIGAGPTGLSLAAELDRYGVPFRIVDKKTEPVVTSNALVVQTRTLEIWRDLGVLESALQLGHRIHGAAIYINRKKIAELSFAKLKSDYHFVLALSQHQTEVILNDFLKEKNQIKIVEGGVELISLVVEEKSNKISLRHADGLIETVSADFVVACDGSHSWVRDTLRIPFVGKQLKQHFVLADLEIQSSFPSDQVNLFAGEHGIFAIIQYDEKYCRIIADVTYDPLLKEATSLTKKEIERLIAQRCPFELKIKEPIWTSGFWINERLVKNFRANNIFFAGDAAHIHSPAGGQGMNTGIQDANNLAWKLAWVIHKKANPLILNTYQTERAAVAKKVLRGTTLLTNIMTLHMPILQWIRNIIMRRVLKIKKIQEKIVNTIAQLNIYYPSSMLVKDCLGGSPGLKPGTRSQSIAVSEKCYTLLFFMGINHGIDIALFYDYAETLEKKYGDLVEFVLINTENIFEDWRREKIFDENKNLHERYGANKPMIVLIRPDKYIGFRSAVEDWEAINSFLMHIS